MMLIRWAVAIALLTTSWPVAVAPIAFSSNELRFLCVRNEWIDQREARYCLVKPDDYEADLKWVRQRFESLKYAPPLADVERFNHIHSDDVYRLIQFNRAYKTHLETMQGLYPDNEAITQTLKEVEGLYKVWDVLRDAKSTMYMVNLRREGLHKLRQALGDSYAIGTMCPPVPYWRFVEVR